MFLFYSSKVAVNTFFSKYRYILKNWLLKKSIEFESNRYYETNKILFKREIVHFLRINFVFSEIKNSINDQNVI